MSPAQIVGLVGADAGASWRVSRWAREVTLVDPILGEQISRIDQWSPGKGGRRGSGSSIAANREIPNTRDVLSAGEGNSFSTPQSLEYGRLRDRQDSGGASADAFTAKIILGHDYRLQARTPTNVLGYALFGT